MQPHEHALLGCLRLCIALSIAVVLAGTATLLFAWHATADREPPAGYLGSPVRGRALLARYGCPACHAIPGSAAPDGMTGPPLAGIGSRGYLAGKFANEPIELEEWIQHPQKMKPESAMPELGVTDRDARDLAAYLATLRR